MLGLCNSCCNCSQELLIWLLRKREREANGESTGFNSGLYLLQNARKYLMLEREGNISCWNERRSHGESEPTWLSLLAERTLDGRVSHIHGDKVS